MNVRNEKPANLVNASASAAYVVSLCIYNIGSLIADGVFSIWTVVAFVLVAGFLYLLFRPTKEAEEYKKAAAN